MGKNKFQFTKFFFLIQTRVKQKTWLWFKTFLFFTPPKFNNKYWLNFRFFFLTEPPGQSHVGKLSDDTKLVLMRRRWKSCKRKLHFPIYCVSLQNDISLKDIISANEEFYGLQHLLNYGASGVLRHTFEVFMHFCCSLRRFHWERGALWAASLKTVRHDHDSL